MQPVEDASEILCVAVAEQYRELGAAPEQSVLPGNEQRRGHAGHLLGMWHKECGDWLGRVWNGQPNEPCRECDAPQADGHVDYLGNR